MEAAVVRQGVRGACSCSTGTPACADKWGPRLSAQARVPVLQGRLRCAGWAEYMYARYKQHNGEEAMNQRNIILCVILCLLVLTAGTPMLQAQAAAAKAPPKLGDEVLSQWNDIHQRLIVMAEDFPEAKYEFKATPEVRTFAAVLLHVAGTNFGLINAISGKKMGPTDNDPPRATYKTKADVVALLKKSTADGAALIKEHKDRMLEIVKNPESGEPLSEVAAWLGWCEHSGEHYGQLVVYYRISGMVPPESRPKPK